MKSKKADFAADNIIVIILVLLVIAVVLLFIFKPSILDWLRIIPGYKLPSEDQSVDIINPDNSVNGGGSLCSIRVGKVVDKSETFRKMLSFDKNIIYFCGDNGCNIEKLIPSKILWVGTSSKADIEVDQWNNDKVGYVVDGLVTIDQEIIKEQGDLYEEVKKDLPNHDLIIKLNGARYLQGYLCKDKIDIVVNSNIRGEEEVRKRFTNVGIRLDKGPCPTISLQGCMNLGDISDNAIQDIINLKLGSFGEMNILSFDSSKKEILLEGDGQFADYIFRLAGLKVVGKVGDYYNIGKHIFKFTNAGFNDSGGIVKSYWIIKLGDW